MSKTRQRLEYVNTTSMEIDFQTIVRKGEENGFQIAPLMKEIGGFGSSATLKDRIPLLVITDLTTNEDILDILRREVESFDQRFPYAISCMFLVFDEKSGLEAFLAELKPNFFAQSRIPIYDWKEFFEEIKTKIERYVQRSENFNPIEVKTIEFKPEFKQAGVQILSYFQETLNQKYPDNNVTVRISQHSNTVTMEIETPEGEIEKYEKALKDYGLVVAGKKEVNEYLPNDLDQLAMEYQIKLISTQLEFSNKLIAMKDQVIKQQEYTIEALNTQILTITNQNSTLTHRLVDIIESSSSRSDIIEIFQLLDSFYLSQGEESLRKELDELKKSNKGLFIKLGEQLDELSEKVILGVVSTKLIQFLTGYF